MKYSRSHVNCKTYAVPELRFEEQSLTSFSGLVVFQQLFAALKLKERLRQCFTFNGGKIYKQSTLFLQLIIHILLGFRELRDSRVYRGDPLVQRILGLKRLPDVGTLSRMLKDISPKCVDQARCLLRDMVLDRLKQMKPTRITLDFDGSVQSTRRHAEGTAVGFNKKKKGARSYYPLFCTVAQTGQVLDFLHRPGNVHDSNGASVFIMHCLETVHFAIPGIKIEIRMDSAFFNDEVVRMLRVWGVEFTISVPFERFPKLKRLIEERRRWHRFNKQVSYFEHNWKPECWERTYRFLFIRTRTKLQNKAPVQLDLFVPYQYGYEFKVIITNKTISTKKVVAFHDGRGAQENIIGELKSNCQMDHIPVRTRNGNQLYLLATLFAHNLARELQMATAPPVRRLMDNRAALWCFEKLQTLRNTWLHRAGRLNHPNGKLTLTISANKFIKQRLLHLLDGIKTVAARTAA